jgi:hypothetical protein
MPKLTRRDHIYLTGLRAEKLTPKQAATAWHSMALRLEELGKKDIPKYRDVITAIRLATIDGKTDPINAI